MIVTFYSYKGGTGRTMALANVAVLLARSGLKVLMVDFDLEAPGLPRFFTRYAPELSQQEGLIDLLPRSRDWRDYVNTIVIDAACSVHMITSGRQDDGYAARVLDFQWQRFFAENDGAAFVESLRAEWSAEYDIVLVDSRTGITDTGGICTIALPDVIVPVFTANQQSVDGVIDVLRRAQAGRQDQAYDRMPVAVLPLPSKLDTRTELESAQEWMDVFADRFEEFYADWLPKSVPVRKVIERTKLPYVAYFSFGEQLPVITQGTTDPDSLGYAMNIVATLLAGHLTDVTDIVEPVPSTVTRVEAEDSWDFFVSYARQDRAWAEWIAWELEERGHRVLVGSSPGESGTGVTSALHEGVIRSDRVIAVLSEAYLRSAYGSVEWQAAWREDPSRQTRRLLTVRVEDCERPGLLGSVVSADLFGLGEQPARDILQSMLAGAEGRMKPAARPSFPGRRRLLREPRFPGSVPRVWNVPPNNPNFVGRERELAILHQALTSRNGENVCSLRGMAGVGKSALAISYAHRFASDYDVVWWIPAERPTQIVDHLNELGAALGLDVRSGLAAVLGTLRSRTRWLLVFDNAQDPMLLREYLPSGDGDVIITTRRGGFGMLGALIELDVLARDGSLALLSRRLPSISAAEASELTELLSDLPLAIEQAAGFLDATEMPVREYLELLRTRTIDALSSGRTVDRGQALNTLWEVSLTTLASRHPAALQLLELLAQLANDPVPLGLFTNRPDLLPEPLSQTVRDPLDFAECIGVLTDQYLVRRSASEVTLAHRLLQLALRNRGAGGDERLAQVVQLLAAYLPDAPDAEPGIWRALLPHVLRLRAIEPLPADSLPTMYRLLNHTVRHLLLRGRSDEAVRLAQRSLELAELVHGPAHLKAAPTLTNLAAALHASRRSVEAVPLLERAVAIQEAAHGPGHPDVAVALANLGYGLAALEQYQKARPLFERALAIQDESLGAEDPIFAATLSGLGMTLMQTGDFATAAILLERALAIAETTHSPDLPAVVNDLNRLAGALSELGRAEEAQVVHGRALEASASLPSQDDPSRTDWPLTLWPPDRPVSHTNGGDAADGAPSSSDEELR